MTENDNIAAIATAPGRSGIGVVRISGPQLDPLIAGIIGRALPPRHAVLAEFFDARHEVLDQGIALYFPAPWSYTGQAVLELHGHGGPLVLQLLLKRCLELGARLAQPGEFTRRAYLNDKLDLAQAESVADLIDAATEAAARSALRSLRGEFSKQINELVNDTIDLRARVEAAIDFPDEEGEFLGPADGKDGLAALRARLANVLSASQQGSLLREGIHVVLAGQPNVGKSSLLNRLAGEELAIVTEIPGTTRDAIRQSISLEGIAAHIIDTAGLRESSDPVEMMGIARTWAAIEKADLVLLLIDATLGENARDREILAQMPIGLPCIKVMNKIDLQESSAAMERNCDVNMVWLSARTGAGVDLLRQTLLERVGWRSNGEGMFMARERHVQALRQAQAHLERADQHRNRYELFAEELRLSQQALGAITGEFTSDDLLGEIFSRFCIGK
jgi:tRNA modification GTPase